MEDYILVERAEQLAAVAQAIASAPAIALDTETTGLCPHSSRVRLISVHTGNAVYVIDLFKTGTLGPVLDALRGPAIKVLQNAKFDQKFFLHHYGLELNPVFDTYRASAILYNGKNYKHDLFALYERELEITPSVQDLGGSNWAGSLTPEQYAYSASDVELLLLLRDVLKPKLQAAGLNRCALLEFRAVLPEAAMELNGFRLNSDKWLQSYEANKRMRQQMQMLLLQGLPHPDGQLSLPGTGGGFNLGSTQMLQKSLARLGLKLDSTKEMVLAMHAGDYPIVRDIIAYKKIAKLCSSFGPDYLQHVNEKTGRVHSSYYPFTGAGRYACVASGTLVVTSKGAVPIANVRPGDLVLTHKGRFCRVSAWLPQGVRETWDVRLSTGAVLTCTPDHRVLLMGGRWATLQEIKDEYFQDVDARCREQTPSCSPIQAFRVATCEGHSRQVRNDGSQRAGSAALEHSRNRTEGLAGVAILGVEGGIQESNVRQNRGGPPWMDRGVRRRAWIPDVYLEGAPGVRASCSDDGSARDGELAREFSRASHRFGQEEQCGRQPGFANKAGTPPPALFAGEGQSRVEIEAIHVGGSLQVYDLSVENDESYQTQGIFSHNCSSPNLQQVPRTKVFRECFEPEPGWVFTIADYCVRRGTRVALRRGLIPVEEVVPGDLAKVEDGSLHEVAAVISKGVQPIYRITTSLGYELEATSLHRIRVLDVDGAYIWKRVRELGLTDCVGLQGDRAGASEAPKLPMAAVLSRRNVRGIHTPEEVDSDLAFFLGYVAGEGSFRTSALRGVVSWKDPEVAVLLTGVCARVFEREGLTQRCYRGVVETDLNSVVLMRWLAQLGVAKTTVPEFVWKSPQSLIGSWLRGLFEADGSCSGRVSFTSKDLEFVRDVQRLLLGLGILTARRKQVGGPGGVFTAWTLTVPFAFNEVFAAKVGFASERKQGSLQKLVDLGVRNAARGGIPNMQNRVRAQQLTGPGRVLLNNTSLVGRPISLKLARRLRAEYPDVYHALGLHRTVEMGTFFDSIRKIELVGEDAVYDLSVPGPVTYISDGFVSHNSQVELRIAAEISGDRTLMGVYQRGEDAHKQTASIVNEVPLSEVTKGMRQLAKPINFGLIYGLGAEKLVQYAQASYGVSMKLAEAVKFIDRYFAGYAGIKAWHRRALQEGKRTNQTRTMSGRIRYFEEEAHNQLLNCVDFETEALTRRGWVRGPDLVLGDELLTKNAVTGALEWQRPTDLKVFAPAERELVEFKSRSFHALSTSNHRWLVYSKSCKRDVERETHSISRQGDDRIHRTGRYEGPVGQVLSDGAVELAGWWLTGGHLERTRMVEGRPGKRGPKPSGVTFRLYRSEEANAPKAARIEALLKRLGIQYTKHANGPGHVTWYFRHPVTAVLAEFCPRRVLTWDLLNVLTAKQCRLLLQTMLDGDGCRSGKTSFVARTLERAEAFQGLCTLCGVVATIVERGTRKFVPKSAKLTNIPKGTRHWLVTLLQRDKVQVQGCHVSVVKGVFGVWCPMVPNTFFVARRSGHVFITGNTPVQGCLPASVRVLTSEGYGKIGEIPQEGTIWTGTSWEPYERVSKGKWQRAEITLANGQVLQCDTRHEVLCVGDGAYEFVGFADLLGRKVCLSLATSLDFGSGGVTEAEAYWLGFCIGNGHTSRNSAALTFGDRKGRYTKEAKAQEWAEFCGSIGFPSQGMRVYENKITVVVENKAFRSRWESLGYCWAWRSSTKRIPICIWNGARRIREAFLIGVLDSDGTVGEEGKTTPSIHLGQKPLLEELQVLVRTLGVESKLRGPYEGSWRLDLNGGQMARLGYGRRMKTTVPGMLAPDFVVSAALQALDGWKGSTQSYRVLLRRLRCGGSCSVYVLQEMLAVAGVSMAVPLYAWSEVVRAEALDFEEDTHTLRVHSPLHRFDSEGVISKNTGADGLKNALYLLHGRLSKYGGRAKMVHMVHDEIVLEVKDEDGLAEIVKTDLEEAMKEGMAQYLTRVPVEVEGQIGSSWADK